MAHVGGSGRSLGRRGGSPAQGGIRRQGFGFKDLVWGVGFRDSGLGF